MISKSLIQTIILTTQEAAGPAGEHAAKAGGGKPHIPNLLTFVNQAFAEHYEVLVFALFMALVLIIGALVVYRKRQLIPGPFQNFVEMLVEGLYSLVHTMLGKETDRYIPFIGTLFLYIWFMNLSGIIPFLHAPTSSLNTTASLAITVFLYVQYTAITRLGPWAYVKHLMGDPGSLVEWLLVPINLPIHIIGEFVKPFSLALRLFGNILGEDILIATMVSLGVLFLGMFGSPVGFPFQIPFYFLALLTSTIQALVFTMLTTAYFMMVLPHEEH
jgi:F-type H+-transporting ATPase subunit a